MTVTVLSDVMLCGQGGIDWVVAYHPDKLRALLIACRIPSLSFFQYILMPIFKMLYVYQMLPACDSSKLSRILLNLLGAHSNRPL